MSDRLRVSVVYALPDRVFLRDLELPAGSTVQAAIQVSGVMQAFPELGRRQLRCGIFSRAVRPESRLADGDRVELYRELEMDPMTARRRRAARRN